MRLGFRCRTFLFAIISLFIGAAPLWSGGTSLRFFGNGTGDVDRVKILISPQVPADVGTTDFTIEFWMKANPGDNAATNCITGNDGWINGNIIFDRDVNGAGDFGDYGISLFNDGIAFGVHNGTSGEGICGTTNVADSQWHHIAVTRDFSDGEIQLYVDGVLEASTDGPDGNISYNDAHPNPSPNDPFLVIGAEKHDAGPQFPSYNGWVDEIRISTNKRYTDNFTRPSATFALDGNTVALYHFDEGSGNVITDSDGGGSDGIRNFGGSPAGPIWSPDKAPVGPNTLAFQQMITSNLNEPVALTHAGDGSGRLFITEQEGVINVWNGTTMTVFMDISDRVRSPIDDPGENEEGLLSVAFHPDYENNGYFYVYYTSDIDPNAGDNVIARYSVVAGNPNQGNPNSEVIILAIDHPGQSNHNGGQLQFGPDGKLYIGTGDGGGSNDPNENGQNINVPLGKMLRIDVGDGTPPYTIPPDNPFVGVAGLDEIWAYGLRNPWRYSFDRLNGDMFIGDVGQNAREEVDQEFYDPTDPTPGGLNWGWDEMEGTQCFEPPSGCNMAGKELPILEYTHSAGRCSISGGYIYRGTGIPQIFGRYFYADYCTGEMWGATRNASGIWSTGSVVNDFPSFISGFGEGEDGELYGLEHDSSGIVYRFTGTNSNLALTITDNPDPVLVDTTLTYTFNVINNGPSTANSVILIDELPPGVTFISSTHTGCAHNSGVVTCNLGNLNNGGSVQFDVSVMPTAAGSISNTAIVSANQNDSDATNNTDTETTQVDPLTGTNLALTKSDSADPVDIGTNLTYTIQVTNAGPDDATGVTVTDTLPGTVTFVSASAGCNESGGIVTCTIGNLSSGANTNVSIDVTVNNVGTISNTATVTGNETDPAPGNNSDTEDTQVVDPNACLFCDDFNDNVLSTEWTYVKPTWNETGGALVGTPDSRKAEALATPIFLGCSSCGVEAIVRTAGGEFNKLWVLGWWESKLNLVELLMKEESDTWILKQRINKSIVAKAKAQLTIDPDVNYEVRITFNGTTFEVFIDDVSILTMPAVGVPSGVFGFRVKNTTGFFDSILVN